MAADDYILDLSTRRDASGPSPAPAAGPPPTPRPWLAIHWRCCHVYSRVYRNPSASHYLAQCPSCGRSAKIEVAPTGLSTRFLEALP